MIWAPLQRSLTLFSYFGNTYPLSLIHEIYWDDDDPALMEERAIFLASTTASTLSLETSSHSFTCTLYLFQDLISPHMYIISPYSFSYIYHCLFLTTLWLTLIYFITFFKLISTAVTLHLPYTKFNHLLSFFLDVYFLNYIVFFLFFF